MEVKKELTIKELIDEMKFLKSRLIKLAEKYNRSLISVSAITWKDIVTSGGKKGDIMLNKIIKTDDLENEFDIVKESYNSYRAEAVERIREMIATKTVGYCIVYFRDELHWKWDEITKLFNYSRMHCKRLYNIEKNK